MKIKFPVLFIVLSMFCTALLAQPAVVQSPGSLEDRFPKRIGGLRFSEITLRLGQVYTNETRVDTIHVLNSTAASIAISPGLKVPDHIKLKISPEKLDAGKEGMFIISYSGALRKEFGFVLDRIMLKTTDPTQADKNINITATIKEYFPVLNPADSLLVPRLRISEMSHNFGRVQQGEKVKHEFVVFNDGQKELILHQAKSNCGCIKSSFSKALVPPGESSVLSIEFDSFGKEGSIPKDVVVYANDPKQSELTINILAEVWK